MRRLPLALFLVAALGLGAYLLRPRHAAAPTSPSPPQESAGPAQTAKATVEPSLPPAEVEPSVTRLGGNRFRIGQVEFDKAERTIRFPASVNMTAEAVEYLVVTREGKVHESVFVTDAAPADIQVAALLLGLEPSADLGPADEGIVPPRASALEAWVEWDRNGPPAKVPLHECVALADPHPSPGATLPAGLWLFNGSRVIADGTFLATRDGSVISIIRDPDSLINFPGASRDNDDIHRPNAARLPALEHPVRIVLRLRPPR